MFLVKVVYTCDLRIGDRFGEVDQPLIFFFVNSLEKESM